MNPRKLLMLTGGNRRKRESSIKPKPPPPRNPTQNPNGAPPRILLLANSEKHPNRPGEYRNKWKRPRYANHCECRPYRAPDVPYDEIETCPGFQRSKEKYAEYLRKNKTLAKNLAQTTQSKKGKDVQKERKEKKRK